MDTLVLENAEWRVEVLPECGGKLRRLLSKASGREWLWSNPVLPVRPAVYGESYIEQLDSGGWDEIFPSVSPGVVAGLEIPDHGDLVALPCTWEQPDEQTLLLRTAGRCAPFVFMRTLRLDGPTLRFSYQLENRGETAFPFLWCAHPLFALGPGMTIELPEWTALQVRSASDPERANPSHLFTVPDSAAPDFKPLAVKAFTEAGAVSSVRLTDPSGSERLTMAWDVAQVPYLGLWINYGAWSGCGSAPYFNLALEPTTAPYDALADALEAGCAKKIEPSETVCWELVVRVTGDD
ncbi:aldose epimerase family protein [Pontiella sulfatireligans]|uniref:Aldose 1-epimerase n=1 Tax=Pontiella sulfatireligans TaxID=2750658 RepID=A0A6C2UEP6_9BACT|nr:hypothetical protein [Pontiella sulfatireligans]VGO18007.1 hypothetical protein SCARR_00057 [Pontiella sulfatireligans]